MLTTATVKAARLRASPYKLWDAGGLYLHLAPTGLRSWRWRDRRGGSERVVVLGTYPDLSIDQARVARDARRDGGAAAASTPTFEQTARAWHAAQLPRWSAAHARDVMASLARDAFPAIGALPLAAIDARRVLEVLRAVEARGAIETARRLRERISAVFAFDLDHDGDPAAKVRAQLARAPAIRRHPALTEPDDVRSLWRALAALPRSPGIAAAQFQALTAMRSAAVIGARWQEIENIDGDVPLWRVPAARMKLGRAKKADAANDHLVPLSPAAVALLGPTQAAGAFFAIGEAALRAAIDRAGFADRHVPHGWRASFSTILNEERPGDQAAIDRALGHAARNADGKVDKVESAYNRAQHLTRRRELFDRWAAILCRDGAVTQSG